MATPSLREFNEKAVLFWAGALIRFLDREQKDIGTGTFSPAVGTTSLIVSDQVVTLGAGIFLQPRNAEAALLAATSPGIFVDQVIDGSFQVTSPEATGAEVFGYLAIEQDGDQN